MVDGRRASGMIRDERSWCDTLPISTFRMASPKSKGGAEGKLTSSKWAVIAKCSQDTASRDIDDLLRRHILVKDPAGGRSTSYSLVASVADSLNAIVHYIRAHMDMSVWDGPNLPTPEQKEARLQKIGQLVSEIEVLAELSRLKQVAFSDFDTILAQLNNEGFFPDGGLVSAAASEFHNAQVE